MLSFAKLVTCWILRDPVNQRHHDLDGLVRAFDELYERWISPYSSRQSRDDEAVAPYSAHEQARKISAIYETICAESDST